MLPFWIALGVAAVVVTGQLIWIVRIRREAATREEIFRVVTENAADMIAMVDMKGRRLYNSPSYKRILGWSVAELQETSSFEQIHPEDRYRVLEAAREAKERGVGKQIDYRIRHKDGSWRVFESTASTIRDGAGEVAKLVIINRDITERRRMEQQLEHHLLHDALTGLPNRRLFLDRLQTAFVRSRSESHVHTLILANIDNFKVFNETMGAAAGDHILLEVARRISAQLRLDDVSSRRDKTAAPADAILFRLGGDEFAVLLDTIADPSSALRIAKRIQEAVAEPFTLEGHEVRVSLSIGIAVSLPLHQRPEELLKDADGAMRRGKAMGGSRAEVFDEAMHSQAVGRLRLESDLRTALSDRQFRVLYQPVVHLATRRVQSFESLLRWNHPTQGLISPYRFLDAAEDTGILVSAGHWLISQVCRQLREWEAADPSGKSMCATINVSARQFTDAQLVNDLQAALQETGIDPARLQLEMTEAVVAADPRLTITLLAHLKHLGIGVVLDDFGTGSASLTGLRQFPVDVVKIDRSLVREMQGDRAAADIVDLIITLAHKMNLKVVAEGVETARQAECLIELGCEYGQGYFFAQPLEPRAAQEYMQKQMAAKAGAR